MKQEVTGHVYDIQGYSVHDGPGIRTTVFTKGCPLRCLWCHSPESQNYQDELSYMALKCVGIEKCGLCLKACSKQAIGVSAPEKSLQNDELCSKIFINREKCNNCLECAKVCPAGALMPTGYDISVKDALERVLKDKAFYGEEGGVTISGGEPMSQFAFTYELAKRCREEGITVCIDTTGYCKGELFDQIIPYTDLFLYDLKHMDTQRSKKLTGVNNELILENARRIAAKGGKLQIRVPTIPKLNANLENMRRTAAFCRELGEAVTLVQILPYHRMGVPKYERLDRKYPVSNVEPPDDGFMEERLEIFRAEGLKVQLH